MYPPIPLHQQACRRNGLINRPVSRFETADTALLDQRRGGQNTSSTTQPPNIAQQSPPTPPMVPERTANACKQRHGVPACSPPTREHARATKNKHPTSNASITTRSRVRGQQSVLPLLCYAPRPSISGGVFRPQRDPPGVLCHRLLEEVRSYHVTSSFLTRVTIILLCRAGCAINERCQTQGRQQ